MNSQRAPSITAASLSTSINPTPPTHFSPDKVLFIHRLNYSYRLLSVLTSLSLSPSLSLSLSLSLPTLCSPVATRRGAKKLPAHALLLFE